MKGQENVGQSLGEWRFYNHSSPQPAFTESKECRDENSAGKKHNVI